MVCRRVVAGGQVMSISCTSGSCGADALRQQALKRPDRDPSGVEGLGAAGQKLPAAAKSAGDGGPVERLAPSTDSDRNGALTSRDLDRHFRKVDAATAGSLLRLQEDRAGPSGMTQGTINVVQARYDAGPQPVAGASVQA